MTGFWAGRQADIAETERRFWAGRTAEFSLAEEQADAKPQEIEDEEEDAV